MSLANRLQPDLTVVGPELPLTLGVVDEFTRRGWPIFGPTQAASRLELSKSFAKEFLQRHHIPTAHFAICDSMDQVRSALGHFHTPVVVKADGLAAGKGVVIARSKEEAASTAAEMLSGRMVGDAGARVVLEECLEGDELSFLVFSDGERVAPLVAAHSIAITAARPSSRLCSTVTGKPSTPMSASLMASLANRGRDSSLASGRARVLLPDPGGPATSTKTGVLRCRAI